MRIVHYYPTALVGSGVTVALWAWAGALARAGVEVLIACADVTGERPWFTDVPPGVDVIPISHRGRRRLTTRPVNLARGVGLRPGDVAVLHEGWVPANLVAALAFRRHGTPFLVMPHGVYEAAWRPYLHGPVWARALVERRLLEAAAGVHVFFSSEREDVLGLAPGARCLVAPTGFPVPTRRWVAGGDGYLAWVGRYDPYHKGLDILVDAVATMPEVERPMIRLRGYDYRGGLGTLHEKVAALGLGRWIEIGQPVEGNEKTAFLLGANGYLHPARWESYGLALVEALALGIPCLVTDSIRIAESLGTWNAAIIVKPEPASLAVGLRRLLRGASPTGSQGRAYVESELAWDRILPAYLNDLERLTARR